MSGSSSGMTMFIGPADPLVRDESGRGNAVARDTE
jgi:hypothetical protein